MMSGSTDCSAQKQRHTYLNPVQKYQQNAFLGVNVLNA